MNTTTTRPPCWDDAGVCEGDHRWTVTAILGGHQTTHRLTSGVCPDVDTFDASMEAIAFILNRGAEDTSGPWAKGYIELRCDGRIIRTMPSKEPTPAETVAGLMGDDVAEWEV